MYPCRHRLGLPLSVLGVGLLAVLILPPAGAFAQDPYPEVESYQPLSNIAMLPVTIMHPPGERSQLLALGVEDMIRYYLDGYYRFICASSHQVRTALVTCDLRGGPSQAVVQNVADQLNAQFVIYTTLHLGAETIALKGFWYDAEARRIVYHHEVEVPAATPLEGLQAFARTVAYLPEERFERGSAEVAFAERPFCQRYDAFMHYARGKLLAWNDQFDAARRAFQDAVRAESTFVRAREQQAYLTLRQLAIALQGGGGSSADPAEAMSETLIGDIESLQAAFEQHAPRDYHLAWTLAQLWQWRQNQVDNAVFLQERAVLECLALRPNLPGAWEMLLVRVKPQLVVSRYSQAADLGFAAIQDASERLTTIYGPEDPFVPYLQARVLNLLGQRRRAIPILEQIRESDPHVEYPHARVTLAALLSSEGERRRALDVYRELLAVDPCDIQAHVGVFESLTYLFFSQADANGDGIMTLEEFPVPTENPAREARFHQADLTQDQRLERREFRLAIAAFGYGPVVASRDPDSDASAGDSLTMTRVADELWEEALIIAALAEQPLPLIAPTVADFLNAEAAQERLSEWLQTYRDWVEIAPGTGLSAEDLGNALLITWYLVRTVAQQDLEARRLAERIDEMDDYPAASVALALYPERDPMTRFAKLNLPPDAAYADTPVDAGEGPDEDAEGDD